MSRNLGKYEQIGGFKCYVGTPTGDYPKNKVILFLTDVFGLALQNNLVRDTLSIVGLYSVMTIQRKAPGRRLREEWLQDHCSRHFER